MRRVALVDMDGTICDYDKAMSAEMAKIAGPDEPPYDKYGANFGSSKEYLTARRKLIQNQPGFWRNLEPLSLGFEIVEELTKLGYSLNILTQGPKKSLNAWGEKVEWCNKHLAGVNITITQDKALSYGRVLVDDFSPYFLRWLEYRTRGLVVCVAHPWNEMFAKNGSAYQDNIFRYDGTNREELRQRLQDAFNR